MKKQFKKIYIKKDIKKILCLFLFLSTICVACDVKKNSFTEKEKVIIGETDKNVMSKDSAEIITNEKSNEGEVLVIIKKGYGDITKNKNELLKNAKIIFTFSDDDEKEAILLVKDKNYTTNELIEKLKDLPEVISVEPNYNLNNAHIN